jgi:hypothetical protein
MTQEELEAQVAALTERLAQVEADLATVPSIIQGRRQAAQIAVAKKLEQQKSAFLAALPAEKAALLSAMTFDQRRTLTKDWPHATAVEVARSLEAEPRQLLLAALEGRAHRVAFDLGPAPRVMRITLVRRSDGSRLASDARSRKGNFVLAPGSAHLCLETDWDAIRRDEQIAPLVAEGYMVAELLDEPQARGWAWSQRA